MSWKNARWLALLVALILLGTWLSYVRLGSGNDSTITNHLTTTCPKFATAKVCAQGK